MIHTAIAARSPLSLTLPAGASAPASEGGVAAGFAESLAAMLGGAPAPVGPMPMASLPAMPVSVPVSVLVSTPVSTSGRQPVATTGKPLPDQPVADPLVARLIDATDAGMDLVPVAIGDILPTTPAAPVDPVPAGPFPLGPVPAGPVPAAIAAPRPTTRAALATSALTPVPAIVDEAMPILRPAPAGIASRYAAPAAGMGDPGATALPPTIAPPQSATAPAPSVAPAVAAPALAPTPDAPGTPPRADGHAAIARPATPRAAIERDVRSAGTPSEAADFAEPVPADPRAPQIAPASAASASPPVVPSPAAPIATIAPPSADSPVRTDRPVRRDTGIAPVIAPTLPEAPAPIRARKDGSSDMPAAHGGAPDRTDDAPVPSLPFSVPGAFASPVPMQTEPPVAPAAPSIASTAPAPGPAAPVGDAAISPDPRVRLNQPSDDRDGAPPRHIATTGTPVAVAIVAAMQAAPTPATPAPVTSVSPVAAAPISASVRAHPPMQATRAAVDTIPAIGPDAAQPVRTERPRVAAGSPTMQVAAAIMAAIPTAAPAQDLPATPPAATPPAATTAPGPVAVPAQPTAPVLPPAATDTPLPAAAEPARWSLPAATAPVTIAVAQVPLQPQAGTVASAAQVFGAAMRAVVAPDERVREPVDGMASVLGLAAPQAAAPAAVTQAPLDMRQERWPEAMIARIEILRDAADANDTRIRLVPDALGAIDVSVKRDGDTVRVHFTAEQAATRTLLQDAQPRLAELAEARGLKLAQQGTMGAGLDGQAGQQRQPATPQPRTPTAPPRTAKTADAETDTRLA